MADGSRTVKIEILGDAAKAVSALHETETSGNHLEESLGKNGEGIGSFVGETALKLGELAAAGEAMAQVGESIHVAEELGQATLNLDRETGMTAENSSALLAAFERYGISGEMASKSLGNLSKQIEGSALAAEHMKGGLGASTDYLKQMGIAVLDASGHERTMDDVLGDVADKFKELPAGADKTALAMHLFGKAGKDMIPVLDMGKEGMHDLEDESRKLGLTLSGDNVAQIEKFRLAQVSMSEAIGGVKLQLGVALMPLLTQLAGLVISASEAFNSKAVPAIKGFVTTVSNDMQPALSVIGDIFKSAIVPAIEFLGEHQDILKAVGVAIGVIAGVWGALTIAMKAWNIVAGITEALMTAIESPIILVIGAVALLAAGVYLLKEHWAEVTAKVPELAVAWGRISTFVTGTLLPSLKEFGQWAIVEFGLIVASVKKFVEQDALPALKRFAEWFISTALPVIERFAAFVIVKFLLIKAAVIEFVETTALPALKRFAAWFMDTALPAIESFAKAALEKFLAIAAAVKKFVEEDALPALIRFGSWFMDTALPAIEKFAKSALAMFESVTATVKKFVEEDVLPALKRLSDWFVNDVIPAIGRFASWLKDTALPAIKQVIAEMIAAWEEIKPKILPAIQSIRDKWDEIYPKVLAVIEAISAVVLKVFGAIAQFLSEHGDAIKHILKVTWDVISGLISATVEVIKNIIKLALDLISGNWSGAWNDIKGILKGVLDAIGVILTAALELMANLLSLAWDGIKKVASEAWNALMQVIYDLLIKIRDNITNTITDAKNSLYNIWTAIRADVENAWNGVKQFITDLVTRIRDTISNAIQGAKDSVYNIWVNLRTDVENAWNGIKTWIENAAGGLKDALLQPFKDFKNEVGGFLSGIPGVSGIGNVIGHFATGTTNAPGGLAWVGENGPELVNLPSHSQVFTSDQSRHMATGGGVHITQNITGVTAEDVQRQTRKALRHMGIEWSVA
jgi:phage-related protein